MKPLRFLLFTIVTLGFMACSNENSTLWNGVLGKYRDDASVDRLLLVKCGEDTQADALYYTKKNGEWVLQQSGSADIGKNGLGKRVDGDMKTPEGDFDCWVAFGILPNPGTDYEYVDITESVWACEEEGEYYNCIVDTTKIGHPVKGEHMIEIVPDYNYGMHLNYNPNHKYPLGNSIFLHGKGKFPYTYGCVAIDESFMKRILTDRGTAFKVCIHRK